MGKISQTCDLIRVVLHLEGWITTKYHTLTLNSQCVLLVLIGINSRYICINYSQSAFLRLRYSEKLNLTQLIHQLRAMVSLKLRYYSDKLEMTQILLTVCAYSCFGQVSSFFWGGWSFWDRTRKAKWSCTAEDVDEVKVLRSEELGHWSKANSLIN